MAGSPGPVAQILPLKASCMSGELKEPKPLLSASLPARVAQFWKKPLRTGQSSHSRLESSPVLVSAWDSSHDF